MIGTTTCLLRVIVRVIVVGASNDSGACVIVGDMDATGRTTAAPAAE
jgi:hypothetical protein